MNIILEEYKMEYKREYKALDEGIYNGIIKDASITKSKSGKEMLVVTLELQGDKMLNGAHLGGRIERYYIVLNDKYTASKMFSFLHGAGIDVKVGDEINIHQLIISNVLTGKNVLVKLNKSTYTDKAGNVKECNKVQYIKRTEQVVDYTINDDDIPF